MGLVQCGDGARLALEAFAEEAVTFLDGDHAVQARIAGLPHLAHATHAERRNDFVRTELLAWGKRHYVKSFYTNGHKGRNACATGRNQCSSQYVHKNAETTPGLPSGGLKCENTRYENLVDPIETGQVISSTSPAKRTVFGILVHWMRALFVSVLLAVVVILFLYQPVKAEGTSMMPTLDDQERIFINKFVYRFENIDRGDTVVFWYPGDPTKSYIKRVIGVPGDRVEVDHGTVLINGQALDEYYVPPEFRDSSSMTARSVPTDEYFVLGDHRSSSNDSRAWGMVPRRYIYGKAVFVYWPLDKMGLLK